MNEFGLDRQSSIEKEPRTLNNNQIQFAREAALNVVKTRSNQEAVTIFTEGLEPVVRCGGSGFMVVGNVEATQNYNKINNTYIRDIVSAPF